MWIYRFLSSILKVVPLPSSEFFTKIRPLWYSSMMRFANESPSPHPRSFVVKPGVKTMR